MRSTFLVAGLASFLPAILALTITSPAPGSNVDPSKSFTIQWTSDSSDPSTFDLKLGNENTGIVASDTTIATGVKTSDGSFTVQPGIVLTFGSGFQILAINNGKTIAQTTGLTLGNSPDLVSTASNGQLTLLSTVPAAATTLATTATADTSASGATTAAGATSTSSDSTATSTSSSDSSSSATGLITSTTSRSSSQTTTAAPQSTSSSTANSQRRLGGEYALGAAGMLAGFVAFLV